MEIRLDGKVAVVTGGSRGIGLATARLMREAGAAVMLVARKAGELAEAAASLGGDQHQVGWMAGHAGDPDQVEACAAAVRERFGAIDILVNNAATNPYYGPLTGIDPARAAKTVEVNQLGPLYWVQAACRHGLAEGGGAVVNMSSVGGLRAEPGIGWYSTTKAALVHMTRQMALELGPAIRVNALAPGLVRTELARQIWEPAEAEISARLPLGRLGDPDDVARAALFLASDAASWITGHTLVVDGGTSVIPSGGVG